MESKPFKTYNCVMVVGVQFPKTLFDPGLYFCRHPLDHEKTRIVDQHVPKYLEMAENMIQCGEYRIVNFYDPNVLLLLRKGLNIKIEVFDDTDVGKIKDEDNGEEDEDNRNEEHPYQPGD